MKTRTYIVARVSYADVAGRAPVTLKCYHARWRPYHASAGVRPAKPSQKHRQWTSDTNTHEVIRHSMTLSPFFVLRKMDAH